MVDNIYPLPLGWNLLTETLLPCIEDQLLNEQLAMLFAKRFIQRRDVKAVQFPSGKWSPDRELERINGYGPVGFQMDHLYQHLNSQATYGHYLLDDTSHCRMFAFDFDLRKEGTWVPMENWHEGMSDADFMAANQPVTCNPRELWTDRSATGARSWFKTQMGMLARKMVSGIQTHLGLPCAAAYSGSKGIHVYGFTGPLPAEQVRAAAHFVVEASDEWELERGQSQYRHKLDDPMLGYGNFSLEVFPKQDNLEGKDLGNLMRLPLGRNFKNPQDPCFFLDLNTPINVMAPHPDPVALLEGGNPYA